MSNSSRAKRILDCDKFSDQFVTAIRALRCLMICMGIWPDKKHDKLYYLLRCFHSVGLVFLLSGEVCWLTNVKDDIDEFFATLGVACALFYVLGKWLTFSWQKVLIRKLTKFMDEDWINLENNALIPKSVPDSKRIMMKHYRTLNIYVCTIVLVYIFTAGEFVIDFLVATNHRDNDTNLGNLLPLTHSWYPLDYDRGYTVQLLAAAQMISMVSALVGSTVVDGFFVITVLHTAGQLEILGDFIERTKYDPMDYECDKTKVKEMAKRHQVLLSVADDIQECFSATILLCVTVSLISTCFHAHAFLRDWINLENNTMIYKNVRDSRRIMTKYYQALNIFILTILFMAVVAIGNFMTDSFAVMNHRGNDTDQNRTLIVPYSWYHHNGDRGYTNQVIIKRILSIKTVMKLGRIRLRKNISLRMHANAVLVRMRTKNSIT
ncbi:uncharacterized protein LOC124296872 isoform X1 [Neodiprion virginianus]|uniref:uncharacterized protein LOC124296872 isoform X1 n=1 Tax=Neodiprion virginianus TaxID=2961670 RepID=UPI001EE72D27|nr:uncharacterized protein LOC124296872 isoform X1 [Neodiprion virginianus]